MTDWYGVAAFVTALAALGAPYVRKDGIHGLRNTVNALALKVAVLESHVPEVERRLASIDQKLDRVLGR